MIYTGTEWCIKSETYIFFVDQAESFESSGLL